MHVIKMVKSVDELFETTQNPNDLLSTIFSNLLFGFKIYDYNKYSDKECDNYTMSYKLNVENKMLNISLGKEIIKKVKKHDIELMVVYAENILDESKKPVVKTYMDGIIELKKDETMFDIFDNTYITFKEEKDYEDFMNKVLSTEKEKE